MDKEAILKAELFSQYSEIFAGREVMFIKNFLAAMESYSTELRKENDELKKKVDKLNGCYFEKFNEANEKDKEIAELKNDMQTMEEQDKLRCETYEKLIGQMEEQQRTIDEFRVLLEECEEYMDDRSDADNGIPNKEMNMLCEIQSLLSKHNSKV